MTFEVCIGTGLTLVHVVLSVKAVAAVGGCRGVQLPVAGAGQEVQCSDPAVSSVRTGTSHSDPTFVSVPIM
jgi:hypothetical protein